MDIFSPVADSYLMEARNQLLPQNGKGGNISQWRDYPRYFDEVYVDAEGKRFRKFIRIGELRDLQLREFKKLLAKVDEESLCSFQNKTNTMTYISLNNKLQKFTFKSVEATCRPFSFFEPSTKNSPNDSETNCKIFKIGGIRFKGELKEVLDNLVKKCVNFLCERGLSRSTNIANIEALPLNDAMAYTPKRCEHTGRAEDGPLHHLQGHSRIYWPCKQVEEITLENQPKLKQIYLQKEKKEDGNVNICFLARQPFGYAFYPYIDGRKSRNCNNQMPLKVIEYDDAEDTEDTLMERVPFNLDENYFTNSCKTENAFIFDNLFITATNNMNIDLANSIMGVYKKNISPRDENFLCPGKETYSALFDFRLQKIGISRYGINLNLELLTSGPMFYTKSGTEAGIPSAREYLTNLYIENSDGDDNAGGWEEAKARKKLRTFESNETVSLNDQLNDGSECFLSRLDNFEFETEAAEEK